MENPNFHDKGSFLLSRLFDRCKQSESSKQCNRQKFLQFSNVLPY